MALGRLSAGKREREMKGATGKTAMADYFRKTPMYQDTYVTDSLEQVLPVMGSFGY